MLSNHWIAAAGVKSRAARRVVLAVLVAATATVAPAVTAHADFGIIPGSFTADSFDGTGALETQAGVHPHHSSVDMSFTLRPDGMLTDDRPKDVAVDLPAGFVGNPQAVPVCPASIFALLAENRYMCPVSSQVGVITLRYTVFPGTGLVDQIFAVYNIPPAQGEAAAFGVNVSGVPIRLAAVLRPDTNTVRVVARNIGEGIAIAGQKVTIWGVPSDHSHDTQRICDIEHDLGTDGEYGAAKCTYAIDQPRSAFLRNPTSCTGTSTSTARATSWQNPLIDVFASYTPPAPVTGCEKVPFAPAIRARPTVTSPDAPSGLVFDLDMAQPEDPDGIGSADLSDVSVTLPDGMTINPASAGGLAACSDEQLALGSGAAAQCPEASKIGSATATTPLLDETVSGGVYVGTQRSDDPASGDMFRIFMNLVNDQRGLNVKLVGKIKIDPNTGRITTTFANNPQLPVSNIHLELKSGSRAPLATPATCGAKSIDAELVSWAGHDVALHDPFAVDCVAGLGGFAPSLSAGVASPVAGAFSPFALSISKPDGNVAIDGLSMVLPTGLVAKLKGNIGAQVGSVKAFAGPGSSPFVLPGKVFLEGAYGDAPFSLRVVVPAKAGPFDLGEVVVRQKIYVDPVTAQVTVVSDPVPTIVKGVPVRLQRLDVSVDKPGFMINPTSCAARAVGGTLRGAGGQTAAVNVRFQVGDCGSLALKPSLALSLSGKGQTVDGKHPAVTADLTQPFGGQANLKKVRVALPLSLALDPDNANGLCEFVDGSKSTPTCPKASIVGSATAVTPILDEPLSGPVYFVKNIRKDPKSGREIRTLPKLVIPLTGQNGVKLTLTGTSDVENDQLVTTFDNIPDAPVSSFKLNIIGGKGGILTVSGADVCKATQIADQQIDGQNNKNADTDVSIQTPSCSLKILSKKVGKTSVAIKVGGLGAGKVTATGRGIRKTTKTIAKSTVATITVKRTKGKPGKVTVSFDPTGPAKVRKTTK